MAFATDIGRRKNNEDAVVIDERLGLAVVADGMGGYEGGEIASQLTVDAVRELVARSAREDNVVWPYPADLSRNSEENELLVAARLAHEQVAARRRGVLEAMGATLAAVRVRGGTATIVHVGDSRVYLLRAGEVHALTRDHSLVEELRRAGEQVPARAQFAYGNVITRAIGTSSAQAEVQQSTLAPGDLLVVCTDGLWEPVPEAELLEICATLPLELACRRLVEVALAHGGSDNITVAMVAVS